MLVQLLNKLRTIPGALVFCVAAIVLAGCTDKAPEPKLNCAFTALGKSYSTLNVSTSGNKVTASGNPGEFVLIINYGGNGGYASFSLSSYDLGGYYGVGQVEESGSYINFTFDLSVYGDPAGTLAGSCKCK